MSFIPNAFAEYERKELEKAQQIKGKFKRYLYLNRFFIGIFIFIVFVILIDLCLTFYNN